MKTIEEKQCHPLVNHHISRYLSHQNARFDGVVHSNTSFGLICSIPRGHLLDNFSVFSDFCHGKFHGFLWFFSFTMVFLVYHGFKAENHLKSARTPASTPCARRALRGSAGFGFGFAAPGASRCRPPGRPRRGLGDTLERLDIDWGNGGKMMIEFR